MKNELLKYISLFLLVVFLVWLIGDLFFDKGPDKTNKYAYEFKEIEAEDSMVSHEQIADFEVDLENPTCFDGNVSQLWVGGDSVLLEYAVTGDFKSYILKQKIKLNGIASAIHYDKELFVSYNREIYKLVGGKLKYLFKVSETSIITSIARFNDLLVLADAGNKAVFIYDMEGNLKRVIDAKEDGSKGFIIPSGYFALRKIDENSFWVVNPGYHELYKFTIEGERLAEWGKSAMDASGFCGCCNPNHFWLTQDGKFITTEKGLTRIKVLSSDGELESIIAPPSHFEPGTILKGIFSPDDKHILVVDDFRKSIVVFREK